MNRIHTARSLFKEYETAQFFKQSPRELYEPVNYIMSIGGKRIRPLLVMAGFELFKPDIETVLPAAYAVELFHAFTLVHDDIMDAADLRRGQRTVHKKYNENIAILSGDVMQIVSLEYLLKLPKNIDTALIFQSFLETARGICEGQQMDINFEARNNVSVTEYLTMIQLKTAILLGLSLKLGALAAGQNQTTANTLYQLGVDAGMMFQIKDDLLDSFGSAKIGKKVGGDILRAKKTYLVAKTMEKATQTDQELLIKTLHDQQILEEEKINRVLRLFDKYDIKKEAQECMAKYQNSVQKQLSSYKKDSLLNEILDMLRVRTT